MTLQELRQARKLTQVRMAKTLGISQDGVSRLEKRSDLLLSTLRKSVEAMGGNLSLVAEFPDREPVVLSGIAATEIDPKPLRRKHAKARH
jgi:transcriptional regulator with XRE-family HTH domain